MNSFKFFNKNEKRYNELIEREAIEFLYQRNETAISSMIYEMTTTIATYKLIDYSYRDGLVVAGEINVFPLDEPNIRITFKIRDGEIIQHTVNLVYSNVLSSLHQAINYLRRED